jgi:hypothetical protein
MDWKTAWKRIWRWSSSMVSTLNRLFSNRSPILSEIHGNFGAIRLLLVMAYFANSWDTWVILFGFLLLHEVFTLQIPGLICTLGIILPGLIPDHCLNNYERDQSSIQYWNDGKTRSPLPMNHGFNIETAVSIVGATIRYSACQNHPERMTRSETFIENLRLQIVGKDLPVRNSLTVLLFSWVLLSKCWDWVDFRTYSSPKNVGACLWAISPFPSEFIVCYSFHVNAFWVWFFSSGLIVVVALTRKSRKYENTILRIGPWSSGWKIWFSANSSWFTPQDQTLFYQFALITSLCVLFEYINSNMDFFRSWQRMISDCEVSSRRCKNEND